MSFAKIRPRRDTAEKWTSTNPVLAEGEIAIEVPSEGVGTGIVNIKIGDGSTAWKELPYAFSGVELNEKLVKVGYTNSYKKAITISTSGNTEGYEAYFLTRVMKQAIADGLTDGIEVRYHATWSDNDCYLVDCWGMGNASVVGFTARSNGGRFIQGKFVVADDDFSEYNVFATNSDLANYLPLTGGTLSGSGKVEISDKNQAYWGVKNALVHGNMVAHSDGKFGLYDETRKEWIIYSDSKGDVYVEGNRMKMQTLTELVHLGCGTDNTITEIMTALPMYTQLITGTFMNECTLNTSLGVGGASGILICRKFGADRGEVIWRRTQSPTTIYTWGWHNGTLGNCEEIALRSNFTPTSGSVADGTLRFGAYFTDENSTCEYVRSGNLVTVTFKLVFALDESVNVWCVEGIPKPANEATACAMAIIGTEYKQVLMNVADSFNDSTVGILEIKWHPSPTTTFVKGNYIMGSITYIAE